MYNERDHQDAPTKSELEEAAKEARRMAESIDVQSEEDYAEKADFLAEANKYENLIARGEFRR